MSRLRDNTAAVKLNLLTTSVKLGKDVVGTVFSKSVKTYRENYLKLPDGSDEILVQLEKDVANVILPPVVQAKGGNVYA